MTTADSDAAPDAESAPRFHPCPDCTAAVEGAFCPVCGQRQKLRPLSLYALIWELLIEVLDTDARVWRTLRTLVREPGQLTTDWAVGRRMRHVPPFRLYLVLNVLVFLVFSLTTDTDIETVADADEAAYVEGEAELLARLEALEGQEGPGVAGQRLGLEQGLAALRATRPRIPASGEDADDGQEAVAERAGALPEEEEDGLTQEDLDELASALEEVGLTAEFTIEEAEDDGAAGNEEGNDSVDLGDDPEFRFFLARFGLTEQNLERVVEEFTANPASFAEQLYERLPTVMILLLPVLALAMSLLYLLSGKPYVVHLVGLAHLHAFFFLLLLVLEGFEGFAGLLTLLGVPWLPGLFSLLAAFGGTLGFWYVMRWLQHLYGHGTGGAIAMTIVVLLLHMVGASIGLAVATLFTVLDAVPG